MHTNCILDSPSRSFVGSIQKSPVASHLKGLDPSLEFCCQGPALKCIKKGWLR